MEYVIAISALLITALGFIFMKIANQNVRSASETQVSIRIGQPKTGAFWEAPEDEDEFVAEAYLGSKNNHNHFVRRDLEDEDKIVDMELYRIKRSE